MDSRQSFRAMLTKAVSALSIASLTICLLSAASAQTSYTITDLGS